MDDEDLAFADYLFQSACKAMAWAGIADLEGEREAKRWLLKLADDWMADATEIRRRLAEPSPHEQLDLGGLSEPA
jgi:hypothetical protein